MISHQKKSKRSGTETRFFVDAPSSDSNCRAEILHDKYGRLRVRVTANRDIKVGEKLSMARVVHHV